MSRRNSGQSTPRVYRSLGLSLAIIGVFALFGVFTILPAVLVLILRLQRVVYEPANVFFWIIGLIGLAVMVVSVFAWFGAPRRIRIYFLLTMMLAMLANILISIRPDLMSFAGIVAGTQLVGSFGPIFEGYLRCLLPLRIVLFLYVIWYCNRPIVRDFYARRG
jgi:hypothetical protein